MNGFKEDVISIIRDNMMLHAEAMGLVVNANARRESKELLEALQARKLPVTDKVDKHVFLFDYVVIHRDYLFVTTLLKAFSWIGRLSVLIVDITGKESAFNSRYVSRFGDFTAQKLKYEDRAYLVFKNGNDYGN